MRFSLIAVAVAACCFLMFAGNAAAGDKPLCICDTCKCPPGVCPGGCPVQFVSGTSSGHFEQRCDGKRCYSIWVPDVQGVAAQPVTGQSCPQCEAAQVSEGWRPFQRIREWNQSRPRLLGNR